MADRDALSRGSTRGWSVLLNSWEAIQMGSAYRWSAWCDGESRTGSAASEASAQALAQSALDELVNEARRRSLRDV